MSKTVIDHGPWWRQGMSTKYATKESSRELASLARGGGTMYGEDVFSALTLLEFSELWFRAEQNKFDSGCTSCKVADIAEKLMKGRTPSHVNCVIVPAEERIA